ncbi:PH domain-containing protein [Saccharomonospora sp. NPDC046836]|uniref:PH domain-containing protein n=1 Tax=Saccharomonospora sp. NPDC046836 TaxID=3156921 RepID=UPI0033CFEC25
MRLVAVGWLLAAAAVAGKVGTALSGDRPGTLLLAVATLALLAAAAHGTFLRPRLCADHWGVRIRTLGGSKRLAWDEVDVRLTTARRLGRDVAALELEGEDLVVFGWVELGADPRDVHDELTALRPG